LQRQIAHGQNDLSRNKAESASDSILALNSDVNVEAFPVRLLKEELELQVSLADVVIDATDNFESRFAINEACIKLRKPLVSGSAIRMEGQIAVFDNRGGGPCYRCIYASGGDDSNLNCVENGVLAPVVGIIGAMLALETVKLILRIGASLNGRLLLLDGKLMDWREIKISKNLACPVCSNV
ncbi:HesA/MoeB/ThiF family protein, partial [Gammaproteobacteria bacterium]|nr:HesA/MoeB/ThiF family protein [Gammaproteobacteria bacterium]